MRRLLVTLALLVTAAPAAAHPLGNFSVNHLDRVRISSDQVVVRYLLDQAEIPTFQERGLSPAAVLARKTAEARRGLALIVDGERIPLRQLGPGQIAFPAGQGGLKLTRVNLLFAAAVDDPRSVRLDDRTFLDRVGWKAIQILPGADTAVRTAARADDPTNGLTSYPQDLLESPSDVRTATFTVSPGAGTVTAPGANPPVPNPPGTNSPGGNPPGGNPPGGNPPGEAVNGSGEDGLAGTFADAAAGRGVLVLLLLAAFGWGALHALSPGHGKTMVAAYLVGTRGTPRHAVLLGVTVTITHTIGVFALGFITLALSEYVLPEDLYPWLNLVAGLLVLGVGLTVLRSRRRAAKHTHHEHHHHGHDHGHSHHHAPEKLSVGALVAMGASAGLLPCPSALVVLLGAISQHQIGLGIVMIVAFSLGLAVTLTALGILVIHASRLGARLPSGSRIGRVMPYLPAVSALLIVIVGGILTAQAIPDVVA